MAEIWKTTQLFQRQERRGLVLILQEKEQLAQVNDDDTHGILNFDDAESFLFIARARPPVLGYLLSTSWVNKYTAAVRVVISGKWNTNPHGLNAGSITYHYGYLRTANISNYRHKFLLRNAWVSKLWKEITAPEQLIRYKGEGQLLADQEFYSMIPLKELLKRSTMRYLAVAALWSYWQDNNVLIESRPSDLAVLDFKKHSKTNEDDEADEGKISKGAFATISKRTGVPKKIIPLTLALGYDLSLSRSSAKCSVKKSTCRQ